ncbi:Hemicentin-2-like [Oopsacas minuta]|uniref:Hemicentin-2-like n=1 Tax=Oopsacas minuta TaxID=111878 RepID=A0AAV7JVE6_9METZ|nr:Hemicentin-2-like [Oopsacas minuta]
MNYSWFILFIFSLAFLEDNFLQEPEDTIVYEGQEAFIRCIPPSSLPPAVVTWTHDDVLIQGDGYQITTDGHLVIITAGMADSGVYRCVSNNPLANDSRSSQTAYLLVASPIELTISSELVQTLVDSEVVITCSDTGVPTPSISWTRDNVNLPNSLYPGITINDNQLRIMNALLAHEGYYQCTAVNQVETQVAQVFVDVIQPPNVTAVMTSITSIEGIQSILTCSAAGDPQPVIDWLIEGDSSISLSTIHSVYSNGSLVISYTVRSDAGNYICRGTNIGGEDQDTIALNVSLFELFSEF